MMQLEQGGGRGAGSRPGQVCEPKGCERPQSSHRTADPGVDPPYAPFPPGFTGTPPSPGPLSAGFLAQLGHPLIILFVNLQLIN